MEENNICGCKGIRTCALCENTDRATKLQKSKFDFSAYETFIYVWPSTRTARKIQPPQFDGPMKMDELFEIQQSLSIEPENGETMICDNVILIPDFLSEIEESELVRKIDSQPWLLSQSGKNFVNFNFDHSLRNDFFRASKARLRSPRQFQTEKAQNRQLSRNAGL